MNTLVVYDSQFGNTERVARAIADTLRASGTVRVLRADQTSAADLLGIDLLVLGSPTQGWKPTPAMQSLLASLTRAQLGDVAVACFDTRFRMTHWLSGSAARRMAATFRTIGVQPCVPPESFFVQGGEGPLLAGELERADRWAQALAKAVQFAEKALTPQ